jgi:hypothetical protein
MHPSQTWPALIAELQENILPLYLRHEQTFDPWSVHGRLHICRAVLFAEFMLRHYHQNTSLRPDPIAIRYAIAFHDAGRQGSGADLWEEDSARLCTLYLQGRGVENAAAIGNLITKHGQGGWPLEKRIVHDADVLEIMRPCCGHGGRSGFSERFLRFLGARDEPEVRDPGLRAALIEEAWAFIQVTEERKWEWVDSPNYLQQVLAILGELPAVCPLLVESLIPG